MVKVLCDSEILRLLGEVANVDLKVFVTYDCVQYAICEHRRVLTKFRRRLCKRPFRRAGCKFVLSHQGELRSVMVEIALSILSRAISMYDQHDMQYRF